MPCIRLLAERLLTFAYHCEIHDYVHAKVTVLAATSSQPPTDTLVAGTSSGSGTPWLSILAASGAAIVFAFLGQRALVARKNR